MKKLLLAILLALIPSAASAECNGLFPPLTICGNTSQTQNGIPTAIPFSSVLGNINLADAHILIGNPSNIAAPVLLSGDGTLSDVGVFTLAASGVTAGTYGDGTHSTQVTFDAKGRATSASSVAITPPISSVTGLGTNVASALAIDIGSAGSVVTNGGALGKPSSGDATNLTGTALGLTAGNAGELLGSTWASPPAIGSTTPNAGTFTTLIAGTGQFNSWTLAPATGGAYAYLSAPTSSDQASISFQQAGVNEWSFGQQSGVSPYFFVYNNALNQDALHIDPVTNSISFGSTTASTSPTTGALTVAGGLGVVGDINSGAIIGGAFVQVTGVTGGISFADRQAGTNPSYVWYANGGSAFLYDGTTNVVQVNGSSGLWTFPFGLADSTLTTPGIVTNDATGKLGTEAAITPSQLPIATTSALGGVKPDGTTIVINGSGVISTIASGTGNVTGTGTSIVGNIPEFNNTAATGIQDSGVSVSKLTPLSTLPSYSANLFGTTASGSGVNETEATPLDYGVDCTGATDSTTAVSNLLNSGKQILWGSCIAQITSAITVNLNYSSAPFGLSITGMGPRSSQILLNGVNATVTVNIDYTGNNVDDNTPVVIRDIALVPNVPNIGSSTVGALNLIGSPEIGSSAPNFRLDNVDVIGVNAGTDYANVGIFLKDVRNGYVRGSNIIGNSNTAGSGIVFTSTDNGAAGNAPVDSYFENNHIINELYAIELRPSGDTNHAYSNDWQGIYISRNTLLNVGYCAYGNSTDQNANDLVFDANNCSFFNNAVWLGGVQGSTISNNYFQFNVGSQTAITEAASSSIVALMTVSGNTFYAAPFGSCTAVNTSGTYMRSVATGNVSYGSGSISCTYTVTRSTGND